MFQKVFITLTQASTKRTFTQPPAGQTQARRLTWSLSSWNSSLVSRSWWKNYQPWPPDSKSTADCSDIRSAIWMTWQHQVETDNDQSQCKINFSIFQFLVVHLAWEGSGSSKTTLQLRSRWSGGSLRSSGKLSVIFVMIFDLQNLDFEDLWKQLSKKICYEMFFLVNKISKFFFYSRLLKASTARCRITRWPKVVLRLYTKSC